MIDSTDEKVHRAWRSRTARARRSSTRSTSRTARSASSKVVPLARRYGAALVVGCIDETAGMAVTARAQAGGGRAQLRAADREVRHRRGGPVLRPAGVPLRLGRRAVRRQRGGDHRGRARSSSSASPQCKTVLGISNVSFGLPTAGREVLNSVFLYHCVQAGPGHGPRQLREARALPVAARGGAASSPRICSSTAGADPITALRRALPRAQARDARHVSSLPLEERLPRYIIEGSRDGLCSRTWTQALKTRKPAGDHQRPADDGHGRGGPALQRERAHRRRGAAERRGDEGGGELPRAVHGQGRHRHARQGACSPR